MTHHSPSPDSYPSPSAKSERLPIAASPFTLTGTYPCPVCRHGQIQTLTLMDAFACDFCRHIFTPNLSEQTIQVVDSSQPMSWRWAGRRWRPVYQDDFNLTFVIWSVGIALIALPPGLVWMSSHTFPPLEGSRWSWFPSVWVGATLMTHVLLVGWLLVEHYQFPFYVATKVRLRQWLGTR